MPGLRRDWSPVATVILAISSSTIGLLAITTTVVLASDAGKDPLREPAAQMASQSGQQVGQLETDWPLRSFAQPAFKPDFAAMTATIVAEPAPQANAPLLVVGPTAATIPAVTSVPRANSPGSRTAQQSPSPVVAAPPLRLDTTEAQTEAQSTAKVGPKAGAKLWSKIWPRTGSDAKAEAEAAARPNGDPADAYTAQEVASAKAHCSAMLKGIDAVAIPEEPIRQGNCGTAAPYHLISIGRSPQVTFNPPAVVTCDMVAALASWIKMDLQPSARRHLGSPIAKIETMSSYSCRNAYGRKRGNLSEHGRANALDIRSFVTAAQAESEVLAHWGPTVRDVRAQVAAAKTAADKASAERAMASAKVPLRSTVPPGTPDPTTTATSVAGAVGTMIGSVPSITARLPGIKADTSLGWTPPNRLGGPKQADKTVAEPGKQVGGNTVGRTNFLRDAHTSACRIFGTVLGPEANDAHKNHFHVDMAERAGGNFCE
jgi:hypothetical protein